MTKFTKNEIKRIFMKQLNEQPLEGISVKDLVNECGISRNTFYYHYHDIYEVLHEIFVEDAESSLKLLPPEAGLEDEILLCLKFIADNRNAILNVYNSKDRGYVDAYLKIVTTFATDETIEMFSEGLDVPEEDMLAVATFFRRGTMGLIEEWIESGMKADLGTTVKRLTILLDGTMRLALEKAAR